MRWLKDLNLIDWGPHDSWGFKFFIGCLAGFCVLAIICVLVLFVVALINKPILLAFVAFVGFFGWLAATDRM